MAVIPTLINGKAYDWQQITCNIAGVPVAGVKAISYSEEQEIVDNYGAGNRPVSRGFGNIETEGSITLSMNEVERIQLAAPNGRLQAIPEFDITVTFAQADGTPANHVLKKCRFKNNGRDMSQGDTEFEIELDLQIAEIQWRP
jgi:hypothetical protein